MIRYSLKNPRPELSDPPTVCKILVAVKREGIGGGRESKQYRPSSSSHAALATASGTDSTAAAAVCLEVARASRVHPPLPFMPPEQLSMDCTIAVPLTEDDA